MNPLVLLARALSLHKHRSKTPTGFTPLSKLKKAVLLLDADDPSAGECVQTAQKFFSAHQVELLSYAISQEKTHAPIVGATLLLKRDINWFGRPRKRSKRHPGFDYAQDLFINLCSEPLYTAEHCARCCGAHFKISRIQTKDSLYDLQIESEGYTAVEVLRQILHILDGVR